MPAGESPVDPFAGLDDMPEPLVEALSGPLLDHHVHTSFTGPTDRAAFEAAIDEASTDPVPDFLTMFDSPLGFAIRRWCAPVLDLPAHAGPEAYLTARESLGEREVSARFLRAAGVDRWLLDTGYAGDAIVDLPTFAELSRGSVSEILRLEALGENLQTLGVSPADYPDAFRAALAERADRVVGTKTIVAYRCGFDIDWTAPADAAVSAAVARWRDETGSGAPRLTSPLLSAFGVHAAVAVGLPVQFHVGFGDRDLDLNRVDPLLLLPLLRQTTVQQVSVLLLHCYPYQRAAGYLAQAFDNVYFDVGLAVNYTGAGSVGLIAEAMELAPFAKQLYSSDAFGPAELHLLGSLLWRRGMARVLGDRVRTGDWSAEDAGRVVRMIGATNARRAYGL